jgi:ribonuclease G
MIRLLVNAAIGETRIALVKHGRLEDFQVERAGETALTGNIYEGRVTKVMTAIDAAFVDIAEGRPGFLALSEARHLSHKPAPVMSDCVREGEAVLVKAIREAEEGKGPRLTAKVTLSPETEARRKLSRAPALLQAAPSLLERILCDLPDDVAEIAVDNARTAEAARDWCRRVRPGLANRITATGEVFDDTLEEGIADLFASRVALDNGGWIAIEATEGFTAIDVNSGGFAASGGREQTGLAVNLEAAQAIGRQLRLRGIGGLIVVDFIQMEEVATTRLVESVLTDSLGHAAPTDITMARSGLAVITRKRARPPLSRLAERCACCAGAGTRPTPESVALALLRTAQRSARAAPGRALVARAAPEVIGWLERHAPALGLERYGLARLRFESRPGPHEMFDVSAQ